MANIYTGETKKWDDLTDEQKASGGWIKLPPIEDAGPLLTRRQPVLDLLDMRRDCFEPSAAKMAMIEKLRRAATPEGATTDG